MASPSCLSMVGVLIVTLQLFSVCTSQSLDPRITQLMKMQQRHSDKVIRLDDKTFSRFAAVEESRPYSLVVFFDAEQLHSHTELKLKHLRKEFGLVASTFHKNNKGEEGAVKVFFCDIEFKTAREIFARFGVQMLPHIRILRAGRGDTSEEMKSEQRDADTVARWVETKTSYSVGTIERPPLLSTLQIVLFGMLLVIGGPVIAWQLLTVKTPLHSPLLWCAGALFIYFFSVSGGMFNIIRGMPFSMPDREKPGKIQYFMRGSGQQLGAEGFTAGTMYTAVGILLAISTHLVPRIESKTAQRAIMVGTLLGGFLAANFVVSLNHWKTHYQIRSYWPF